MEPCPSHSPEAQARRARAAACLELLLLAALGWQILRGFRLAVEMHAAPAPPAPIVVDLMRDPAWRIALLPGIGIQRAWNIVRDRQSEPPYEFLEDLERIRGIGPATVRRIATTRTVRVWLDGQPVRCRHGPHK